VRLRRSSCRSRRTSRSHAYHPTQRDDARPAARARASALRRVRGNRATASPGHAHPARKRPGKKRLGASAASVPPETHRRPRPPRAPAEGPRPRFSPVRRRRALGDRRPDMPHCALVAASTSHSRRWRPFGWDGASAWTQHGARGVTVAGAARRRALERRQACWGPCLRARARGSSDRPPTRPSCIRWHCAAISDSRAVLAYPGRFEIGVVRAAVRASAALPGRRRDVARTRLRTSRLSTSSLAELFDSPTRIGRAA